MFVFFVMSLFGIFQSGCIIDLAGCIVFLQLLLPASWLAGPGCFPGTPLAKLFDCAWGTSFASAVKVVVDYGLKHRDLSGITHIGIDEISRKKGHVYITR